MRYAAGIVVAVLFACGDNYDRTDDLTEEVVACEEAMMRLKECCPALDLTSQSCEDREWYDHQGGCETSTTDRGDISPELSLSESRCVRALSCGQILVRGICEKVQENGSRGSSSHVVDDPHSPSYSSTSSGQHPHVPVCP